MKQVTHTPQILAKLQAAYGADADVATLAVYECIALNTQPLRKTGGIFMGARTTVRTLIEIANAINAESHPIQSMHDDQVLPVGRVFYAEVLGEELRCLFAISDADLQAKLDNGTIDQVSVGFKPTEIRCCKCNFNYAGPNAWEYRYEATCPEGHVVGEDGVFNYVDGCKFFTELSLVGKGAAKGAKILGPSDARLSMNQQYQQHLAASAEGEKDMGLLLLTATPKPKELTVDLKELSANLTAAVTEKATLSANLTVVTTERDNLKAELTAANTRLTALADVDAKLTALTTDNEAAKAALTEEVKAMFTALGTPNETVKTSMVELVAQVGELRAKFAAFIPTGGVSKEASGGDLDKPAAPLSVAAFSTQR